MATNRKFITKVIGSIVDNTAANLTASGYTDITPDYMPGHPMEISKRLDFKDKSSVDASLFPLIVLLTDVREDYGDRTWLYETGPFTILIVTNTNPDYTTPDRDKNTFEPVLIPIYEHFIEAMGKSSIIAEKAGRITHQKWNRYFWGAGSLYGNTGNIFNRNLDAIELNFNDGIKIVRGSKCL